jgi:hypothetical protein
MLKILNKLLSLIPQKLEKKLLYFLRMNIGKNRKYYKYIFYLLPKFGKENRKRFFLSAARYLHINRPIDGYYFEFGCNEANTFRMAYDHFKYFNLTYVSFDSFKGLPKIEEIDKIEIFQEGKLAFSRKEFEKLCKKKGINDDKLIIIEGFYENSLNKELIDRLSLKKAAVIYVDCDLHVSTVSVLNFIVNFLQPGTIINFDDWNCFYGDPDRGQKKAFHEFKLRNPNLIFEEFISDGESKSFIFIKYAKKNI